MVLYAGIEGGGTSWKVAIAKDDPTNILERTKFPTTAIPSEVLNKIVEWLSVRQFDSIGIASFGPVELHKDSAKYGYITTTPKPGWPNTDVIGFIRKGLKLSADFPIGFDTDVNAPAKAEYMRSLQRGENITSCVYVTVGTGVGVGMVQHGHMLHGLLHGEGGHISVPPYNGPGGLGEAKLRSSLNCPGWVEVESVTNAAAIAMRAGCTPAELQGLPDDHPVWDVTAHYLACLCVNLILMVSPEKIVLSGGVLQRDVLFAQVQAKTVEYLGGYIDVPRAKSEAIHQCVMRSDHGNNAGIIGACALGQWELDARAKEIKSPNGIPSVVAPFVVGAILGAGFMWLKTMRVNN